MTIGCAAPKQIFMIHSLIEAEMSDERKRAEEMLDEHALIEKIAGEAADKIIAVPTYLFTADRYTIAKQQVADALRAYAQAAPQIAELVEAAQKVVDLDDGDKPDLWHYEDEFSELRKALAALPAEFKTEK